MSNSNINGYQINIEEMSNSTCGKIGIATKEGKHYFCKRFNYPVQPSNNGALSAKARAKNQKLFDDFAERKSKINSTLRRVCGLGGNIIYPINECVYDNKWTEFSEFVEDAIPDDKYSEEIAKLTPEDKIFVLKIAIGALQTIHAQKIVHADLKITNIMLVKKTGKKENLLVSKIIDFDGAFFEDNVPLDSITGTVDYYSPELALYAKYEDDPEQRKKIAKCISTKSDIFSMGLILHIYLTGEKPKADFLPTPLQKMKDKGNFIHPWQVLLSKDKNGKKPQLVMDSSIQPELVVLISDMLVADPEQRPTATEVLNRLQTGELPIKEDTWPEDHMQINIEAAKRQILGLRKMEYKTKDKKIIHGYEIVEKDGRRYIKSKEELVNLGYGVLSPCWEEPRKEDNITWNEEQLKKNSFVSVSCVKPGFYSLINKKGSKLLMSVDKLIMLKLAIRKGGKEEVKEKRVNPDPNPFKIEELELWPEHKLNFKINDEYLRSKNINYLGRSIQNGIKGYVFTRNSHPVFLDLQKCRIQKFICSK